MAGRVVDCRCASRLVACLSGSSVNCRCELRTGERVGRWEVERQVSPSAKMDRTFTGSPGTARRQRTTSEGIAVSVEPPNIDMKRLKYFIAVCNNGGFSRAASAIGIAQPALTRQIKLLEK